MLYTLLASLCLLLAVRGANIQNPIRLNGPDPFIAYDGDTSQYYFLTTTGNGIEVTAAKTLDGLRGDPDRRIVYQNETMKTITSVWAPEIHKLDGSWHAFYTHDSKPYVVVGGATPFDTYPGPPVQLSSDYGIDGTVLSSNDTNYFVWSCLRPLDGFPKPVQSLCISKLITSTSIDASNIGVISQPDQPWEQQGTDAVPAVNEGPQPLYWNGQTYLTYSASFCAVSGYSLGLLHYNGGDPISAASWDKTTSGPVFASANGNYGTGHNGIFASPDGSQLWNVFHAVQNPKGACDNTRSTFVMQVNLTQFDTQGPQFGQVGYYGTFAVGPAGEPTEPESINDARRNAGIA